VRFVTDNAPPPAAPAAAKDLDPAIQTFINRMREGWARYPDMDKLPYPEVRKIIETVRAPWAEGGPKMTSRTELFVPTRHGEIRVRFYYPDQAGPKPALIYLHGGGWTYFSLDTHDRIMREYAARAGVVVVGVDYPLAPEAKFPVALEAILDVTRWLQKNGGAHGIDPARMAMGGDSAGGNLTMAVCLSLRDAGDGGLIKGMLHIYSAFERDCAPHAHEAYGGTGYMLESAEIVTFWNNYLRTEEDARNPYVASVNADLKGLPPAFVAIAECDILADQNLQMVARLETAGVSVDSELYKGASHSFIEAVSIAEVADRAFRDTAGWLRKILKT
jgi:acetyl esterase